VGVEVKGKSERDKKIMRKFYMYPHISTFIIASNSVKISAEGKNKRWGR